MFHFAHCEHLCAFSKGNRIYESGETIELLNCIMSSVVDEQDAALRDFAARALNEFLKWSIKHMPLADASASSASSSYVNIKSILKRLYSLYVPRNICQR